MATGTLILPVQSAKISGALISTGAQIEGGSGAWKLLFDASQRESGIWQFKLPDDYSSAPVADLLFAMATGTGGAVALDIDVMAIASGDAAGIGTASFDSVNTGSVAVASTAGYMSGLSFSLANADSMAGGDLILLRVNRAVANAGDTAVGDMELLGLNFEYTTT